MDHLIYESKNSRYKHFGVLRKLPQPSVSPPEIMCDLPQPSVSPPEIMCELPQPSVSPVAPHPGYSISEDRLRYCRSDGSAQYQKDGDIEALLGAAEF